MRACHVKMKYFYWSSEPGHTVFNVIKAITCKKKNDCAEALRDGVCTRITYQKRFGMLVQVCATTCMPIFSGSLTRRHRYAWQLCSTCVRAYRHVFCVFVLCICMCTVRVRVRVHVRVRVQAHAHTRHSHLCMHVCMCVLLEEPYVGHRKDVAACTCMQKFMECVGKCMDSC
jgi:hypothetical protein